VAKKSEKPVSENDLSSSLDWEEKTEPTEKETTPVQETSEEKPLNKATAFEKLRKELIAIRDKFRNDFLKEDKDVDIEIMYMQGMGIPRAYIVRSMDLNDIEEIETATHDECNSLLEELKANAVEKSIPVQDVFITEKDREDIYRNLVVKTCTLHPENFAERVLNKKVRPGDLSEIYKTAMAFSGFFAPIFEIDDEVQDAGEFMQNKFASNSQIES